MKLSEVREIFTETYPGGWIKSGSEVGGVIKSRWGVYFGSGKIYEYEGDGENEKVF